MFKNSLGEVKMRTICIVLASGCGTRFGGDIPKQFVRIGGRMVVEYTVDVCLETTAIDEILVVVSEPWFEEVHTLFKSRSTIKPIKVVIGGSSRMESCFNGIKALDEKEAKILVHNGVQPFITPETFTSCIEALDHYDVATVGTPCVYTVLELDDRRELRHVVERSHSVNDLGPECFKLSMLRRIMSLGDQGENFTNLTSIVIKHNLGRVYVVNGDPSNTKITCATDLIDAERRLACRREGSCGIAQA